MGMVEKKSSAVARNARQQTLNPPVRYDFAWFEYADEPSLQDAKDELTLEEQLKVRNDQRKIKARTKALSDALDLAGIVKPDLKNNPQMRLKSVYAGLYNQNIADGMSEADAHLAARKDSATILKIDWTDEDDE
jgi:hypothetical protein